MSSHKNRLKKLEEKRLPKGAPVIRVVIYDKETGRAMAGSSPDIVGMTREEINALDGPDTVIINIPDNGRENTP